ncbi:dynamin-2 [Planoprotostelium fungivorum]|uniref:Dynamin-2 n=1 Tax=Planoprotostelium fungivorum TaxID=1890364 RepID=A0A2P6NEM0_9EUKA|nr:dynamin-2 [Planoprotostelium fungivorum]
MDTLIPVINKLQDAFALVEGGSPIDLPQIVVIGSQSSGKSSVLENIVGKDFLPRGSGIVTRRPLVLQLFNVPSKNGADAADAPQDWGEFLHKPKERFYDFAEIRNEIERETDRLTGKNKGISHMPINLKVYSTRVLNLTLVDLPGITKVPIGDQPKDIEAQIRNMIFHYIEKQSTIILAVTAANTDLTNSDALQLAREVDPEGKRTIGVITKLDLMDKGTDALDMLMGRVVPLRLGYIGVVNRSQADINSRRSITSALEGEREFFSTHPAYRNVASRCGTSFLAGNLSKILMNHIRDCIPDMKQKINVMITKKNDELATLGDPRYDTSPGALLLSIINQFSAGFIEMIEGKANDDRAVEELYGGARIHYIFNEIFNKYIQSLGSMDGLTPFDIRTAISNATGPKAALFVPEQAFELLARRQIARLRDPAIQCVDLIYDELERIVNSVRPSDLQRFAVLKEEMIEAATSLLKTARDPTKDMINNICNMELAFINTSHPDFQVDKIIANVMARRTQQNAPQAAQGAPQQPVGQHSVAPYGAKSASLKQSSLPAQPPVANAAPSNPNDGGGFLGMFFGGANNGGSRTPNYNDGYRSGATQARAAPQAVKLQQVPNTLSVSSIPPQKEFEIELLESLLTAYFDIVRKNIQDGVPKASMYLMVNRCKSDMQNELVQKLYRESDFERLLSESSDLVTKRRECKETLDLLRKAQSILNEIRDYSIPNPKRY